MKKKISISILILIALIAGVIVAGSAVFTVHPNEAAIVVRLGKAQATVTTTGLHALFFNDAATTEIYTGKMLYDIPASRAEERIEAAVYNATKNTISSMTQDEIIAARGNTLTNAITTTSNTDIDQYGITIEIAEIKALDLPDDNKAAVYSRMISERENIAAGYTAQGNAEAQKVKNDTDKQVSINVADAKAKAAVIRAQGEAEYMKILSAAYNDPDKAAFYNYLRGLDSMEALARSKAVIILDKDSEYAKILYGQ